MAHLQPRAIGGKFGGDAGGACQGVDGQKQAVEPAPRRIARHEERRGVVAFQKEAHAAITRDRKRGGGHSLCFQPGICAVEQGGKALGAAAGGEGEGLRQAA